MFRFVSVPRDLAASDLTSLPLPPKSESMDNATTLPFSRIFNVMWSFRFRLVLFAAFGLFIRNHFINDDTLRATIMPAVRFCQFSAPRNVDHRLLYA